MALRFLPWARRGLAAELTHVDDGGSLPATGQLPVSIRLGGDGVAKDVSTHVETYGPGNVTGLDMAAIVRVVPTRGATDAPPDEFAAVEFYEPDLPWMFTPAKADGGDRLRPWLVLIVVRKGDGVRVRVPRGAPLPVLEIDAPAGELPDLADSWAWAHAQVTTETVDDDAKAALDNGPGHARLGRVFCPRRLEPGGAYYAALVPAFDIGVEAGLGFAPDPDQQAGPAWDISTLDGPITLPMYHHWEFGAGPAGDFESLARKLEAKPVAEGVGEASMWIDDAHPSLPDLDGDAKRVFMEGALRAPRSDRGIALGAPHRDWTDALTGLLDKVAGAAAGEVEASDAEVAGPPIYGQWHASRHSVPGRQGGQPRWLRDLNADPRHRAAAGLGAEVVRAYQEEYAHAAWKQAGDVLRANAVLEGTRAMVAVQERLHRRNIESLDAIRALSLVDQARLRLRIGEDMLDGLLRESIALPGLTDRSFRRLASPRARAMIWAAKRRPGQVTPRGSARIEGLLAAVNGGSWPEISVLPDGIASNRLSELLRRMPGIRRKRLVRELEAELAQRQARLDRKRERGSALRDFRVARNLMRVGALADTGLTDLMASVDARTALVDRVAALRRMTVQTRTGAEEIAAIAIAGDVMAPLVQGADGRVEARVGDGRVEVSTAKFKAARPRIASKRAAAKTENTSSRVPRFSRRVAQPSSFRASSRTSSSAAASAPNATAAATPKATVKDLRAAVITGGIDLTKISGTTAGRAKPADWIVIAAPGIGQGGIGALASAFNATLRARASLWDATRTPDKPPAFDAERARRAIVEMTRPGPIATRRVASRLLANGAPLKEALATGRLGAMELLQAGETTPLVVGPVLDRALYRDLARHDPDRFLPGAEGIPDNVVSALATNPRFIQSFMVGANHEFNRELLWRRYPSDRRGTAFRRFWEREDDGDDIDPIHGWSRSGRLGTHVKGGDAGSVVLIVRGQLLRRYPNTVIYAVPATANRRVDPAKDPIMPIFAGMLGSDIGFAGFDFTIDEALEGKGMMFVLREQPTAPRFGLDAEGEVAVPGPPDAWSDLSWAHADVEPGGFLGMDAFASSTTRPLVPFGEIWATFGSDAAQLAAITFQRPFRAAIHASKVLEQP